MDLITGADCNGGGDDGGGSDSARCLRIYDRDLAVCTLALSSAYTACFFSGPGYPACILGATVAYYACTLVADDSYKDCLKDAKK